MPAEGQEIIQRNFALTLTAGPVYGRVLTLTECAAVLRNISLEPVVNRLVFFKHINEAVLLNTDVSLATRRRFTEHVLRSLMTPALLDKALPDFNHDPSFRPLSDQALLAALELALRCCPRDGIHPLDTERNLELTHVLLSFQSALFSPAFVTKSEQVTSFESLGEDGQAELVRNILAHNVGINTRHAMGRLYAFCQVDAVKAAVLSQSKRTAEQWFKETFDLTPTEYLVCGFMAGSPAQRLDPNNLKAWKAGHHENRHWSNLKPSYRKKIRALLSLAVKDSGPPGKTPLGSLTDYLYGARRFYEYPMLQIGETVLCVSPDLMLRKFLFGLPYLAQAAAERKKGQLLTESEIKHCRAAMGPLFEGYIYWLVGNLLAPCKRVEVLRHVTYGTKKNTGECDLVLVFGNVAIVIELKVALASLAFRLTGKFKELDRMLAKGAEQAYRAAHALRACEARRADGSVISGVRWVAPCVLTYDEVQLFEPISVFYERHLKKELDLPLFTARNDVEPVQFFDISFVESWEKRFDLNPMSRELCGYLIKRAREDHLRYRPVQRNLVKGPSAGSPHPFNDIVEESRQFLSRVGRSWLKTKRKEKRLSP